VTGRERLLWRLTRPAPTATLEGKKGAITTRIFRLTLILSAALLTAYCLGAGAAAPAGAASPDDEMRQAVMALRGLIDREGAARFFRYPQPTAVRPGHLRGSWWPDDPWTGSDLSPGSGRGHYRYAVTSDRRRYRLVGYLGGGRTFVLTGGMPHSMKLAYDHRSEEGINLIRQYVEDYAATHDGVYPLPADVRADGPVGSEPRHHYWPSNPWNHAVMVQRRDRGSFSYAVAPDRSSYTLRLHRALKGDYVLTGTIVTSPWQQLLASLEDEILRRSGRILKGYVDQWALQHAGALPRPTDMAPAAAVGAAHPDWPLDPSSGAAMLPGTGPGAFTYTTGVARAYTLSIHLHSGDFQAGGIAPSPAAPARGSGTPES
jgi:hypothetical protein